MTKQEFDTMKFHKGMKFKSKLVGELEIIGVDFSSGFIYFKEYNVRKHYSDVELIKELG